MNGRKYRLAQDSSGWHIERAETYHHRMTTLESEVDEVEAMLHGLTLPQLVRDVRAFHEKFGVPMPAKPTGLAP